MFSDTSGVIKIICILFSLLMTLILLLYLRKWRKRIRNEYYEMKLRNEEMNYYLRKEIPKESLERYYNNSIYFRNSNFDYGKYEERLLYEISRLRKDIKRISEIKTKENAVEKADEQFDYKEFIYQLSNMSNIDYLFNLLNEDKEEEVAHVKNVLADIVHTIRNPVSGIRAILAIISMNEVLDESIRNNIRDIEKCLNQIEENLSTYYDISHIESTVNDGENISFGKELNNRIQVLSISSGKKIEFKKHIFDIEIDKRVSKVLLLATTCILENAIWFSPDNGTIIVDANKDNDQIQISIQNNGPIIEPTILDKIFNQGFSTRQSSGRGLAIAKKAVEEMLNGIIVCENVEDKQGVKFSILLERIENNE